MSKATTLFWMPVCALVILVCGCQPTENTRIATGVPVTINLPEGTTRRVYSFNANPASPTTLRFDSALPNTLFTAEVLDSSGHVVAVLSGGTMETASLTLAPATGTYQVALSSTNPDAQGSVRLSILDTTQVAAAATNVPAASTDCQITATHPGGVNVRLQPGLDADVLGVMPPESSLPADARTSNGWYRVYNGGQGGWVSSDVVSASGMCADLPIQVVPTTDRAEITTGQFVNALSVSTNYAPYDTASYYFEVASNSVGNFSDSVSYPDGDGVDRVLLAVSGLAPGVAGERPFAITMNCAGTGGENLRWGAPDNPALGCGDTAGITFSDSYDRQSLLVTLPVGATQSNINYTLHAAPIAPNDAPVMGMGIDLNGGGQLGDMLSYPGGDNSDTIQMGMVNLTDISPDNYRDVLLTLECSGTGIEYVRWGAPGDVVYPCGGVMTLAMSNLDSIKTMMVSLPENSGESYISYTLRAMPIAMPDTEQFMFGFDRDSGGLFNETLSAPFGDNIDTLTVNISNLTSSPPNNFRNVRLTMICGGSGIENIRWGTPEDPTMLCNMSIDVPFLHGLAGQTLVVTLPQTSTPTYARYTLYAVALP